jgi:hypothetical protein
MRGMSSGPTRIGDLCSCVRRGGADAVYPPGSEVSDTCTIGEVDAQAASRGSDGSRDA